MQQNKYDDPEFFLRYSSMPRSVEGLNAAGEWQVFRSLLPPLAHKRVLDLGCGFGWHCRYAAEQQAAQVTGVDISEKMLAQARAQTSSPLVEYLRMPIEDIQFAAGAFDVVISSLALHYVEDFKKVCHRLYQCLAPGGHFVLSVEHPVFTARPEQDWYYNKEGARLHWPVDDYQQQGLRQTRFLDSDVIKYHRTAETYINTLLDAGFKLTRLCEPQPAPEVLQRYPEMKDETRRPIFLLLAAVKQ
ncbi:class I SAM-dependent methyltransferase [Chitinophaga sp.]|uniref:class I SAM-dependent methyltransferase n=1 Tax=Chitinophaga sp. TaxID=1869181 RepID=UPI0031D318AE